MFNRLGVDHERDRQRHGRTGRQIDYSHMFVITAEMPFAPHWAISEQQQQRLGADKQWRYQDLLRGGA